jgi:hypothetical protein
VSSPLPRCHPPCRATGVGSATRWFPRTHICWRCCFARFDEDGRSAAMVDIELGIQLPWPDLVQGQLRSEKRQFRSLSEYPCRREWLQVV